MKLFAVEKKTADGWETMLFVRVEDAEVRGLIRNNPENCRLRPVDEPEPGYEVVRAKYVEKKQ